MQPDQDRRIPPRYSSRPFPPYRHSPGVTPHPVLDPAGHSHGLDAEPPRFDSKKWIQSEAYLYGIDLFNQEFYWEAHEAWEDLWRAAEEISRERVFLHGLILAAAALLKRRQEHLDGMRSLAVRCAAELLAVAGPEPRFAGVAVPDFLREFETALRRGSPEIFIRVED